MIIIGFEKVYWESYINWTLIMLDNLSPFKIAWDTFWFALAASFQCKDSVWVGGYEFEGRSEQS